MKYNRWQVVFGALLIQMSLGAIYIYSVFRPALAARFPDWSATDLALPAQAVLGVFALSMIFSGKIQDKIGPRKTAIAGAGFLLAGMYAAAKAQTLAQFVFGFGVLGGIGIGAAYVCPIAACVKWFPDKRGFITGLAVAGFGAGGLIFAPLAAYFIGSMGIMPALFYLGLIYFFAIVIGASFLKTPAAGYCPAGWSPPQAAATAAKIEFNFKDAAKTGRFWILWLTYFFGTAAGLMVIMNLATIWQSAAIGGLVAAGQEISAAILAAAAAAGTGAVMAIAIFNSLGRIVWGRISDKRGREKTLAGAFLVAAAGMIALAFSLPFAGFVAAAGAVGFCFGGFLALYPAICADYFGTKNIGANYGALFTAYGAGGLLGPWLAPKLARSETFNYEIIVNGETMAKTIEIANYTLPFIIAAALCLAAAFLIFYFLKPKTRQPASYQPKSH